MTKNELARELADDFELPRRQVIELVEAILDRITQVLKSGDKVQLTPFGQFKIRDRAARIARNPQTGEPVNVPAKRVLKFIAGRSLKEAVGTAKAGRGAKKSPAREEVAGPRRSRPVPRRNRPAPRRKRRRQPAAARPRRPRRSPPRRRPRPRRKAAKKTRR